MAGLLEGLEQFDLENFQKLDLFAEASSKATSISEEKVDPKILEEEILFDKTFECPICDNEIKSKTIKNGKVRLLGSDIDLKPRYEGIDILKYDVIICPSCGYAALTRYFKALLNSQGKLIKAKITPVFRGLPEAKSIISYEEAKERYQLVLANSIVKQAKASEKAYICLKAGWLCRGEGESLDVNELDYQEKKKKIEASENEYLKKAMEGFIVARQKESFPMCGMDAPTIDYLLATLSMRFEKYNVASKLISDILATKGVNPRMKDRARDLREIVMQKYKESKTK